MRKKAVTKPSSKVTSDQQKIIELENTLKEYHTWCLEWRRLNDNLEAELQRTQFMLMDAQAVINYLEAKLTNH
jgi:hypothetical protein